MADGPDTIDADLFDDEPIACPHCGEAVDDDAEQRPHCRMWLTTRDRVSDGGRRKIHRMWPWVVGLTVAAFIIWLVLAGAPGF